jgi:hypothetical protein
MTTPASDRCSALIPKWVEPAAAIAVWWAVVSLSGPAVADDVSVVALNCATGVHVIARDAPLSRVLERLAQTLRFQLFDESGLDRSIAIDASMQPLQLIGSIAPDLNISATQVTDPRCPRQMRIEKLWILAPAGGQANAVIRETPEQARAAAAGLAAHLKAHGYPQDPALR